MQQQHNEGDFEAFRDRVEAIVNNHPVVVDNTYTRWFARGEATHDEVRHLVTQFSVFSHLFVEAQLRKVINAPTIEQYHAGKEILMNELGVVFRREEQADVSLAGATPDQVGTEGTVESSRYRHSAAHF